MTTLTETEITAPGTYAVRNPYGACSDKRFRDAVENLKRISASDGCSATYDSAAKTWTVVLGDTDDGRVFAASRLRTALTAYHAEIARA